MTPTTRQEALLFGALRYNTGKPCVRGHISDRYTCSHQCVECLSQRQKENKEEVRIRNAKWRKANPDKCREIAYAWRERNYDKYLQSQQTYIKRNPEKIRLWSRLSSARQRKLNPERYRERQSKWVAANKERSREIKAKWQRENPDHRRAGEARRRARKRSAEGYFTEADIDRIMTLQKGRCAACGKKGKLCVDHVTPLARGGSNWPRNLQLLCRACNSEKQAKDPITFMQERGALL